MGGFFKSRSSESAKRYAPLPRQRSLARWDDEIWSFMGRIDSTLWFKGNGVKPKAVLHISPSSRKWCWDRSSGSSTVNETEGKLVLEIMQMVLVVVFVALPQSLLEEEGRLGDRRSF